MQAAQAQEGPEGWLDACGGIARRRVEELPRSPPLPPWAHTTFEAHRPPSGASNVFPQQSISALDKSLLVFAVRIRSEPHTNRWRRAGRRSVRVRVPGGAVPQGHRTGPLATERRRAPPPGPTATEQSMGSRSKGPNGDGGRAEDGGGGWSGPIGRRRTCAEKSGTRRANQKRFLQIRRRSSESCECSVVLPPAVPDLHPGRWRPCMAAWGNEERKHRRQGNAQNVHRTKPHQEVLCMTPPLKRSAKITRKATV